MGNSGICYLDTYLDHQWYEYVTFHLRRSVHLVVINCVVFTNDSKKGKSNCLDSFASDAILRIELVDGYDRQDRAPCRCLHLAVTCWCGTSCLRGLCFYVHSNCNVSCCRSCGRHCRCSSGCSWRVFGPSDSQLSVFLRLFVAVTNTLKRVNGRHL